MPTTLCFDLDNTLLDDDASLYACVRRVCEGLTSRLPGVDPEALTRFYINLADGYWAGRPYDPAALPNARLELWTLTLASLGCKDAALAEATRDAYARYRYEFAVPFDETKEVLERLQGRYRLAVITNGVGEQQRARLEAAGLEPYFDVVVAATDIDAGKPDPAVFQHTLDLLGARPGEAWHIGDSLTADVVGARSAGLEAAVWLNRNGNRRGPSDPEPHFEIGDLLGLPRLLERYTG